MFKNITFILVISAIPVALSADSHNTPSDLSIQCNANGAVIRVNNGHSRGKTFYLGKSCDAAQKGGGTGKWWYAAAAFIVEINGSGTRFANEIDCPALPYCRPN